MGYKIPIRGRTKAHGSFDKVEGRIAVIEGVKQLMGAPVEALDLRAGAALVLAALFAKGKTEISNVHYTIEAMKTFDQKLKSLGADIVRIDD